MITIDDVTNRLNSLGYIVSDDDTFALNFLIDKVEEHIKHYCNINEIPDCLNYVWVDMTCGELLQSKKSMGKLTDVEIEPVVKSIKDGDTTIDFASNSNSDPNIIFNAFVDKLINGYEVELIAHRKLSW